MMFNHERIEIEMKLHAMFVDERRGKNWREIGWRRKEREKEREKGEFFCMTIKNVKGIDRPSFVSFCLLSIYFP